MSEQNHQPEENQSNDLASEYMKVDRRYRESKYFLMDQLRYAESVNDFRSVKQAIMRSTEFNLAKRAFQFAKAAIPVQDGR